MLLGLNQVIQTVEDEMIPAGVGRGRIVSGAMRGTAGYTGYYCTATGRKDRLYYYYYYYTDTENIKHFE